MKMIWLVYNKIKKKYRRKKFRRAFLKGNYDIFKSYVKTAGCPLSHEMFEDFQKKVGFYDIMKKWIQVSISE